MTAESPIAADLERLARLRSEVDSAKLRRPSSTRVITIANQKGGVGKTTTAVNLAAALAIGGMRVLLIDSDPQGNASTALGVNHARGVVSTYDVLTNEETLADVIDECPSVSNLRVCPATIDLAGVELELVSRPRREFRLRDAIEVYLEGCSQESRPDFIIIDCPPSLGLITLNACVAASEILVPVQAEYYALEGLSLLMETLRMIENGYEGVRFTLLVLLTLVDSRTRLSADVTTEVRSAFGESVFDATIPRSVRLSEAPSYGETVITYDPRGVGAIAYRQVAIELCNRRGPNE